MRKNLIAISILMFLTQVLIAKKSSIEHHLVRSISTESLGVDVNISAYSGPDQFYIVTNENEDKSLSRIAMERGDDGNWTAVFIPMAPATDDVIINAQIEQSSPLNAKNISNLVIGSDTFAYKKPVVGIIEEETPEEGEDPTQKILLFQVTDTNEGKRLLKTSSMDNLTEYALKDTSTHNAKGLHALAATQNLEKILGTPLIFALVSDNANLNEATPENIGVIPVIVGASHTGLNPLDGTNFDKSGQANKAVPIINILKITNNPTLLENATADMFWDDNLQRLFIATSKVQTGAEDNDGAIALLVGNIKIETTKNGIKKSLQIQKCANLSDKKWPTGNANKNWIVGYKNDNTPTDTKEQIINLHKVRTMHTSTGKDYVIINGGVAQNNDSTLTSSTVCEVYALPVMPSTSTDSGKLAKANDDGTFAVITQSSELIRNTDIQAIVGNKPQYLVHTNTDAAFDNAKITDMQISGDTVYVAVAGSRTDAGEDTAGEAGIFASTAIFNEKRVIRAWTPWQRVMGYTDKVFGLGFDTGSNNFWYIGPDQQTGKITIWSSGDTSETGIHEGSPLNSALSNFFHKDELGIVNLINFDDETSGFKTWNPESAYPAFSMMIALGLGKVALIETGKRSSTTSNKSPFEPTKKFDAKLVGSSTTPPTETTNVFVFNDTVTQSLGFITAAEVARIKTSLIPITKLKQNTYTEGGWLFIGGQNGVAVLRKSNGSGWNTTSGLNKLSNTDFPGKGYSFIKLTPPTGYSFSNIRKLISDGKYLYILTRSDLYRLEMNANDFTDYVAINSTRIKLIASINGTFQNDSNTQVMNKYIDEFFDLVLIDNTDNAKKLAIATTQGVWASNTIEDEFAVSDIKWNKNITRTGEEEIYLGPSLKFDFLPVKRGGTTTDANGINTIDGNLYVTAIDYKFAELIVCRFNVQNGAVTMFDEPYISYGTSVPYFYKLANLGRIFMGTQFGPLDHVGREGQLSESIGVTPDPSNFLPTTEDGITYYKAIDLDMDPQAALHIFSIIQNTASGALYIPGEFNVFVNE